MRHFIGIDGGGTRTTLALADETGRELLRRVGAAGLVDPRRPSAAADLLVDLIRDAMASAGVEGPVTVLCAGLAGVGNRAEREVVESTLERAGVAERVCVLSDGETALHGALDGGSGILLIAGTGSVAYGRAEDGTIERCGGWGMWVGDEGSGYDIGRASLRAALRSVDGRERPTRLLPVLLESLGLSVPDAIPSWVGRVEKADVAALAVHTLRLAREGDEVAGEILRGQAAELARHAEALIDRLAPWTEPPAVVLHGGVARDVTFAEFVRDALAGLGTDVQLREPAADAVAGAVQYALLHA